MLELTTFSISAKCARTGMLGTAVSTAVPGVGGICCFVEPKVGAIATQAWVNPYLGIDGLSLLKDGLPAQETLDRLIKDDPGRDVRQVGIVDSFRKECGVERIGLHRLVWPPHRTRLQRAREHAHW